ncbi:MAG: 30S ribosomal protein S14 [Mesorhizobium sp.]|uniref:30S ribosomal protein S14 n=1 Tax=Mesorhizobium sp. TaxID=1871066 RepID=UPI000FE5E248|nr:30S ribosomal protein S14 [Mesorhizobium sp.]RWD63006.1 MAG: 30S ribosomal protein S14 [Mesorhizobium sp.]RWE38352.1 MAG: 30S ribosomal protein S14 [Mesorhizobium sp.]
MAKTSSVEKNNRRRKLASQYAAKRKALKEIVMDQSKPMEERFRAQLKLSALPRNSAKIRIRNRCEVTGRPRAYYRKLKLSRIALRDLGNNGQIPGLVKSSW